MATTDTDLDRDLLLRELEDQRKKTATDGTTTVDAPGLDAGAAPAAETPATPAIDYGKTIGDYGGRLEGFDSEKLGNGHDSAKYQIGRTLSHFDPRQGITPEALAALNGLGIGTFSGQGDKLHVTGGTHGLIGDTNIDAVRGFKDPNGTGGWQYGLEDGGGGGAAPTGGALDTDPSSLSKIQSLMPTDSAFSQKLQDQIAQALGGYSSLDREALLKLMGGGA